ncbi:hypothetical protein SA496_15705 [Pseudomonas sp. JS3066]|uniref:hypothetical protein n=1 Tax=Pseudomonas sp. JS3066 TaxID=3090665 RepID=UPI002E7AE718|nr:hypothetical protein [Pseudomonas sp. JS3066]WVK91174.1 hypothetical protein SA496_15705 [Pseudomonas sp. JS3066]
MSLYSKRVTTGDVTIDLTAADLASGWDIQKITVRGMPVPPTRKGEFDTEEEAEAAAVARAEAFMKQHGIKPR